VLGGGVLASGWFGGSGSLGADTITSTVLDECVIGAPWPTGGLPMSLAVLL